MGLYVIYITTTTLNEQARFEAKKTNEIIRTGARLKIKNQYEQCICIIIDWSHNRYWTDISVQRLCPSKDDVIYNFEGSGNFILETDLTQTCYSRDFDLFFGSEEELVDRIVTEVESKWSLAKDYQSLWKQLFAGIVMVLLPLFL